MKSNESAERRSIKSFYSLILTLSLLAYLLLVLPYNSHAQVATSIAADNSLPTPTTVTQTNNVFNINGGTIHGANQFHSFDTFSVGAGDIASFNGPGSISNILSRVTGLDSGLTPSMIYGTIQSTIPGANLFFMNPAGIVFGPTASLNVAGTTHFTTADYLKLAEVVADIRFNAIPGPADSLLTSAPVAAFGFLTDTPAAVEFRGSALPLLPFDPVTFDPVPVPVGRDISVIAGDIRLITDPDSGAPTILTAPGAKLNLVSIASAGEVPFPNFDTTGFPRLGTVTLSGSLVDVSGSVFEGDGGAGTIRIRSGQLVMDGAVLLSATQGDVDGAPTAVDINVTGDVPQVGFAISLNNFSAISSATSGNGRGGDIVIVAGTDTKPANVDVAGSSTIVTFASGDGQAGDIFVTTPGSGTLSIHGTDGQGNLSNIESLTDGSTRVIRAGDSGNISITAGSISIGSIDLHEPGYIRTLTHADGNAGNVDLHANKVSLGAGGVVETRGVAQGDTGLLMITATDTVSLVGDPQLNIAQQSALTNSHSGTGVGGGISVNARNFQVTEGAQIVNTANTSGGPVNIIASDSILISGGSAITSQTFFGSIGLIQLSAVKNITLSDQAVLRGSTIGDGAGGTISLTGESISLSGQSFITSRTVSSGQGGQIQLDASDSVSLSSGAIITTSSLNPATGTAGSIDITADKQVSLMDPGTKVLSETNGPGAGGNITITTGQATTLNNNASISANSTGLGNAGNIAINAGNQLILQNSLITTQANQASGGKIDIRAVDLVRLVNSTISTSVLDGTGGGGDIFIDPNSVVLQNSQILAQAIQGAGGNITITTPLFLADSTSFVSASSQFGLNGTVTIQSPTSNLSGSLGPLTSKPSQAQSLVTQRCAALVNGQASSFVVAGREQLPADPGGWLTSPLYAASVGEGQGVRGKGLEGMSAGATPATMGIAAYDTDRVSLRRLTPAAFLIANFADSEATGCHS